METTHIKTSDDEILIDDLIVSFKELYSSNKSITFLHEGYLKFKDSLTKFIYSNHLDNTNEWKKIIQNLVFKSTQYMSRTEADIILCQLESIKLIILKRENELFWQYVHPIIKELVFVKFNSEQYADAVEAAFKEINVRLKNICKKHFKSEQDGKSLMEYIFSLSSQRLLLADITTESGKNEQIGYMQIFSGAMGAIRNPKAHANLRLSKENAIKRLIFASLLMDKIDEALSYSNILE